MILRSPAELMRIGGLDSGHKAAAKGINHGVFIINQIEFSSTGQQRSAPIPIGIGIGLAVSGFWGFAPMCLLGAHILFMILFQLSCEFVLSLSDSASVSVSISDFLFSSDQSLFCTFLRWKTKNVKQANGPDSLSKVTTTRLTWHYQLVDGKTDGKTQSQEVRMVKEISACGNGSSNHLPLPWPFAQITRQFYKGTLKANI